MPTSPATTACQKLRLLTQWCCCRLHTSTAQAAERKKRGPSRSAAPLPAVSHSCSTPVSPVSTCSHVAACACHAHTTAGHAEQCKQCSSCSSLGGRVSRLQRTDVTGDLHLLGMFHALLQSMQGSVKRKHFSSANTCPLCLTAAEDRSDSAGGNAGLLSLRQSYVQLHCTARGASRMRPNKVWKGGVGIAADALQGMAFA